MSISRRNFIKGLGIFSAATLVTGVVPPALATEITPINYGAVLTNYLAALDEPFNAPLNDHFERVIQGTPVGLILYDINNARLLTALNSEKNLPIASAFKAPMLMYFLDQIERDIWNSVPVQYWAAISADDVPQAHREAWRDHFYILRALHQALVLSDNVTTGTVFSYVARAQGRTDAIAAFNEWSAERVGISQLSGLSAWRSGVDDGMSFVDARFQGRETAISSRLIELDNMMTARDLGMYYAWMLSNFDAAQMQVCKDLLSIIHNDRGANLERLAQAHDAKPYSKNGSLQTAAGYAVSDAGLIELPDGQLYLLVVESVDADDGVQTVVPALFEELDATLAGRYNEILHHHRVAAVSSEELLAAYVAQLREAYPRQESAEAGAYRYGFIMPEGVKVYGSADENDTLHNPIIKATKFGVRLLMQGALIRFVDVDETWLELVPDDHRDNVRSRLGVRIFIKREDVWPISLDFATPLPYLLDPNTSAADKFIVINVIERELVAFEGGTPVLRTPIVLNPDATPRGAQIITSKWYSRSMQPWAPGVPFTAFFGAEGFALHGSPWQRWTTTVNQETIHGRTSAGCVNIPNWMITVGAYQRPADELIFRWLGGMEHQDQNVFDYPSEAFPALRIFSVDYWANLRTYYRPDALVNNGLSWDDIITAIEDIPLQAPDSFFV